MSGSMPVKNLPTTKPAPKDIKPKFKEFKEPQKTIRDISRYQRCYKIREIDLLFFKIKLPPERVKCPNIDTIE